MTQSKSAPIIPFLAIIKEVVDDYYTSPPLDIVPKGVLEFYASRILETPLVYLLNERRIQGKLAGETPEEQYLDFAEDTISVSTDLQSRFAVNRERWQEKKNFFIQSV